jgi:hypothetical protein
MAAPSTAGSRWDEVGCPVCREKDIWSFFEAANVPVRFGRSRLVSSSGTIRRGTYLPVSALRVEAPSFIRRFKPDVILITNPTYKSEIQAHVARLGVRCAFDQL